MHFEAPGWQRAEGVAGAELVVGGLVGQVLAGAEAVDGGAVLVTDPAGPLPHLGEVAHCPAVVRAGSPTTLLVYVAAKRRVLDPYATPEERRVALAYAVKESRHAAALRTQPNVVTVHAVVEDDDGSPWTVMDLVPGRSLARALAAGDRFGPDQVARIGRQVAEALEAAHAPWGRKGVLMRRAWFVQVRPACVVRGQCDAMRSVSLG
ncbi:hypothetical protein ACFXA3_01810 [Streptomyces sp. NPDC059456]|uniref:hypothetical protein n=1 Tax=Streptomyces sp. NPDC059456 TaxID=3346838 RepID=UPI003682FAF3